MENYDLVSIVSNSLFFFRFKYFVTVFFFLVKVFEIKLLKLNTVINLI